MSRSPSRRPFISRAALGLETDRGVAAEGSGDWGADWGMDGSRGGVVGTGTGGGGGVGSASESR